MRGRAPGSAPIWRRLIVGALCYALALQSIAIAVAGSRLAADAAGGGDWTISALCRSDATLPASPADTPHRSAGNDHCVFCVAGGTHLLGAPDSAPLVGTVVFTTVAWPLAAWRLPRHTIRTDSRQRAPPLTA